MSQPNVLVLSSVPSAVREGISVPMRFEVGDLAFDHIKRTVKKDRRRIPLSDMRYRILYMLACHVLDNAERPLSKRLMHEELHGNDWPNSNSLDVQMHRLREALSDAGSIVYIRTFYGSGFKLVIRGKPAVT